MSNLSVRKGQKRSGDFHAFSASARLAKLGRPAAIIATVDCHTGPDKSGSIIPGTKIVSLPSDCQIIRRENFAFTSEIICYYLLRILYYIHVCTVNESASKVFNLLWDKSNRSRPTKCDSAAVGTESRRLFGSPSACNGWTSEINAFSWTRFSSPVETTSP